MQNSLSEVDQSCSRLEIKKETALIMQNTQKPYAVVVGLDHINGLQTVRILARQHIPIVGVTKNPNHYCSRTRLCERILIADTSSEELINSLVKAGPTLVTKAVLYPCTDIIVSIISKFR